MTDAPQAFFRCSMGESFDLFDLPRWLAAEQQAGRVPVTDQLSIRVAHPDREMDGSCRWCGCREDETVPMLNGKLA
jgi:hypothetical protein